MRLGVITDTQDLTGTILEKRETTALDETTVRQAILSFVGIQKQIPPMYSALKVNGKKLCDLARAGVTIERKPRPIEIYRIEIISMDLPTASFRVSC